MSESDVLDVAAVMARYGFSDRRAARRVMDEAGAFKLGSRLLVHAERLRAYEDELVNTRQSDGKGAGPGVPRCRSEARRRERSTREVLPPDWWREYGSRESVDGGNERGG